MRGPSLPLAGRPAADRGRQRGVHGPLRSARISGSFAALVLAMALLGPVPAAAIAVVAVVFENLIRAARGGAARERGDVRGVLAARRRDADARRTEDPIAFAAAVVLVFMVTNALNFSSVAVVPAPDRRSRACSEAFGRSTGPCCRSSSRRRS